jgi:hypothetical protein
MMNLEKYRGVIRGEFPTTDEWKVSKRDQPWITHMMRETIRAWSVVDVRPWMSGEYRNVISRRFPTMVGWRVSERSQSLVTDDDCSITFDFYLNFNWFSFTPIYM